jgi:alpha-galactosidase
VTVTTNDEVLEVNQDPQGKAALRVVKVDDLEVWAKDMEDGRKAVGLFNLGETKATVTVKWSDLRIAGKHVVRDLWRQRDLGTFDGQFSAPVGEDGVVLVSLTPAPVP